MAHRPVIEAIKAAEQLIELLNNRTPNASENLMEISSTSISLVSALTTYVILELPKCERPPSGIYQLFAFLGQYNRAKNVFEDYYNDQKKVLPLSQRAKDDYLRIMTENPAISYSELLKGIS